MAPPRQVAAPPNGSISVGWLWVSFLNRYSQSWSSPFTSTLHFTVQALISSDSSRPVRMPLAFSHFAPMVPMSIRHTGLRVATQLVAHVQVLLVRGLHALVIDGNVRHFRAERGVAAVVRPVRIDHLDFGDGGATHLRFGSTAGKTPGQPRPWPARARR